MMNLKNAVLAMILLTGAGLPVSFAIAQDDEGPSRSREEREVVAIDAVPQLVMDAARRAAPDVFFNSAESYWNDDFREFKLTGRLFREVWTVYVRDDGDVRRVKSDLQDD